MSYNNAQYQRDMLDPQSLSEFEFKVGLCENFACWYKHVPQCHCTAALEWFRINTPPSLD